MPKRLAMLLIGAAVLLAAVRFVDTASVCESGWDFVATQWQDSLGFVGLGHTPVGERSPIAQADYWLREVDELLKHHPDSAEMLMGAAWVLDSPDPRFLQHRVQQNALASIVPWPRLGLDEDAISEEKATFRAKCLQRCLALAEEATRRDPEDLRWWRLRALLQFEGDTFYSGQEFAARRDDCLAVLEEGERRDPENALYGYLAALHLWESAADYEYSDLSLEEDVQTLSDDGEEEEAGGWVLTIYNKRGFVEGSKRFAEAQRKPFLAIGEAGYPAIAEFLEESRLRRADQAATALSRLVTFRQERLYIDLGRWLNVRVNNAKLTGDAAEELGFHKQALRLADQAIVPEETSAANTLVKFGIVRQAAYRAIRELSEGHPGLVSPEEFAAIQTREEELRAEVATLQSALQSLDAEKRTRQADGQWEAFFSSVAVSTVALLLVVAGVSWLVGRLLARRESETPMFGPMRHGAAWAASYAASFAVFGMAPAEIVDRETQRLAALIGVWTLAAAVTLGAAGFVVKLLRQRKIRFRLVTLLTTMTGAAVLASLWPLLALSFEEISAVPDELWMPERGWEGWSPEHLRTVLRLEPKSWRWAAVQWLAYDGWCYGVIAALLLATLWFMWRCARDTKQGILSYSTQDARTKGAILLSFLARSSLGAAACWGALYLTAVPGAIRLAESDFQSKIAYCRDPRAHLAGIRTAQAIVLESTEEMEIIHDQIRYNLYGEGDEVFERDFSEE